MNQIKIIYNINDGRNSINDSLLEKNPGHELDQHDLQLTLSKIIETINELIKEDTYSFDFSIEILDTDLQTIESFTEYDFFEEVTDYETLYPQLLTYIEATNNGQHDMRIWKNSEEPAGTSAADFLVFKDIKWVSMYIDFLRTNDLDHEVSQGATISDVIEQYGWCDASRRLALARLFSCHGQHGKEQMEELLEDGLSKHLQESKNKALFSKNLLDELPFSYHFDPSSKEGFIEETMEDLELLKPYFTQEEIEVLKTDMAQLWDIHHQVNN